MQAGQQGLDVGLAAGQEAAAGRGDPLRLALGEARGGEGGGGQKIGTASLLARGTGPAAEQVDLLLHREIGPDLAEKGLKLLGVHAWIPLPLQPAPFVHQLFQQSQALAARLHRPQVPAEQIQHPEGPEGQEGLADRLALLGLLAHPLQQLLALAQEQGGALEAAVAAQILGAGQAGEGRQQAEIGFPAAAQGWGLGGLQGPVHQLEHLQVLARLMQQQQAPQFLVAAQLQARLQGLAALAKGGELGFVGAAPLRVAEQVGALAQQGVAHLQGVEGEALVGDAVEPLLQGAEHGLHVRGRTDAEQPEMIDRQFQPWCSAGG